MSSWRFLAEAETDPNFLSSFGFWSLQALIVGAGLGGFSVILYRAGRKGLWPSFPWVLALACGPAYNMALFWASDSGYFKDGYILGLLSAWASGGYISLCLSVVLFAVIGLTPPPSQHPPPG